MPRAHLQKQSASFCSLPFFKLKERMMMLFTFFLSDSRVHPSQSRVWVQFLPLAEHIKHTAASPRKTLSPLFRPSAALSGKRGETLVPLVAAVLWWQGVPGPLARGTLSCCSLQRSGQNIQIILTCYMRKPRETIREFGASLLVPGAQNVYLISMWLVSVLELV